MPAKKAAPSPPPQSTGPSAESHLTFGLVVGALLGALLGLWIGGELDPIHWGREVELSSGERVQRSEVDPPDWARSYQVCSTYPDGKGTDECEPRKVLPRTSEGFRIEWREVPVETSMPSHVFFTTQHPFLPLIDPESLAQSSHLSPTRDAPTIKSWTREGNIFHLEFDIPSEASPSFDSCSKVLGSDGSTWTGTFNCGKVSP